MLGTHVVLWAGCGLLLGDGILCVGCWGSELGDGSPASGEANEGKHDLYCMSVLGDGVGWLWAAGECGLGDGILSVGCWGSELGDGSPAAGAANEGKHDRETIVWRHLLHECAGPWFGVAVGCWGVWARRWVLGELGGGLCVLGQILFLSPHCNPTASTPNREWR